MPNTPRSRQDHSPWLIAGGWANFSIGIAHVIGLAWAEEMFEVTGIGPEMKALADHGALLPYVLTVGVAVVFMVFGWYGLAAAARMRPLPKLKVGVFAIAGIYLLRGVGELAVDVVRDELTLLEALYSVMAIGIGALYAIGGWKRWGGV